MVIVYYIYFDNYLQIMRTDAVIAEQNYNKYSVFC